MFRCVSGPGTLLKGVSQPEPGQWVELGLNGDETQTYWTLPAGPPENAGRTSGTATVDEFEEKLRRCVQQQMISDVPLGCQLSGGVDSSLVTKFAADSVGEHLNSYSVVFKDPVYSEEKWIDAATTVTGVRSHKFLLTDKWYADHFQKATWHLDAPLNHPNTLGIMFLAENARRTVTVLLSGEGADEVLGGYNRFFYQQLIHDHPAACRLMTLLPVLGRRISQKLGIEISSARDRFILSTARINQIDAQRIYPLFRMERALAMHRDRFDAVPGNSRLKKCLNYSMQTYLPEMLLRQDKMTMAASLENRVPFLDHEFLEFVRGLPDTDLVSSTLALRNMVAKNTKVILKKIAVKYFGPEFSYRQKEGFAIPLRAFFEQQAFVELVNDQILPGVKNRALFSCAPVKSLWESRADLSNRDLESLWVVLAFEMWAQQFLS
ncbi:MAG: asparagine synthase C-terminal domain-containing protein [Planctomycetaceae bacterium]